MIRASGHRLGPLQLLLFDVCLYICLQAYMLCKLTQCVELPEPECHKTCA